MRTVSILMCSYNGDALLPKTVAAISRLSLQSIDLVEFVFVDNGSRTDLQALVKNIWSTCSCSIVLKTTHENTPGKIAAFITGLQLCSGDFVVVCDDDNELHKNYLIEGIHYMEENPHVGVLGGTGLPTSDVEIPDWFKDFKADYACGEQSLSTGNVYPAKNVVYGAGMWFRKNLLQIALQNGFTFMFNYVKDNPRLKNLTNGGEDGELCWAIKYQGYEIHFLATLLFYHHISSSKFTEDYLHLLKSRKNKYTIMGQIYWRVYSMDVKCVQLFWLKEAIYICINYFKNFTFSKEYLVQESARNFYNLTYLLISRGKYDAIINRLLAYKQNYN